MYAPRVLWALQFSAYSKHFIFSHPRRAERSTRGVFPARITASVTLPNTQRPKPVRPCVHIAMRLFCLRLGVFHNLARGPPFKRLPLHTNLAVLSSMMAVVPCRYSSEDS